MDKSCHVHFNPHGHEAWYNPADNTCSVVVRGYETPDGCLIERGGPRHADDKIIYDTTIQPIRFCGKDAQSPAIDRRLRDVFLDALACRRDFLGQIVFRHTPKDHAERRLFAAAFDAAQKIRSKLTLLCVDKIIFTISPSLFYFVDSLCCRDNVFWCINATADSVFVKDVAPYVFPLAAYILKHGGYVPSNATVRLGVFVLSAYGSNFCEIPNDQIAARDRVIEHLCATPF